MNQKESVASSKTGADGSLPRLYTLEEAAAAFKSAGVTKRALRKEVQAGRIRTVRPSPAANARYLIAELELLRWLNEVAALRSVGGAEARKGVHHGR